MRRRIGFVGELSQQAGEPRRREFALVSQALAQQVETFRQSAAQRARWYAERLRSFCLRAAFEEDFHNCSAIDFAELRKFAIEPRAELVPNLRLDVLRLAWTRDDVDFNGEFYHLKGIRGKPKPFGGTLPLTMNAGSSGDGRAFALRNCDAWFTSVRLAGSERQADLERAIPVIQDAKAEARRHGPSPTPTRRPRRPQSSESYGD